MCSKLLSFAVVSLAESARAPNLVMMVLDDVGWTDVGFHGSDFPTPNIDKLATEEGVRLEKYYVQQVCSPTRSALMTGRYPFKTGMQHCTTLIPGTSAKLPTNVPTIAEALRAVGYRTAAIGKWHLGYDSWDATPIGRGFDSYAGYLQGQVDYYNKTIQGGVDFWRNETCAWDTVGQYSMDFYMQEAERVLDARDAAEPLFLYFAHQEIHIPLEGPPEPKYSGNCQALRLTDPNGQNRHTLCTMMNRLDKAIGTFVEMLKVRDMWEDTLLWVTTDNGGMAQFQDNFPASASSNFPLRGGKATLFEGGVRGVSFVTGGMLPTSVRGTQFHGLLQHVDIPATMAAMAGVDLVGDGMDVWHALVNAANSPRDEVPLNVDTSTVGKNCIGNSSIRSKTGFSALIQGNWKLIDGGYGAYDGYWSNTPYTRSDPDMDGQAVLVQDETVYLFDLLKDPEERHNVAQANPEVVSRMLARLVELGDPQNGYVNPQKNLPSLRALPNLHNGTWSPWKKSTKDLVV